MLVSQLPDFVIKAHVEDAGNLYSSVKDHEPDLVVLDLSGENDQLFGEIRKICTEMEGTDILIISNSQNRVLVKKLLSLGVKGILTKECSEEEITSALKTVSKGDRFFCNNVLNLVVDNEQDDCDVTLLSSREYEVLELITKGFTTSQIAEKLHLSIHTINSHRKNILKKLNLSSPTELIVYALESGLVK